LRDKIHVLHVLRQASGGMREHVATLLKKMDSSIYNLMVACPKNTILDRELVSMGRSIFHVDMCEGNNPLLDAKCLLQLINIIKEKQVQIVHTHGARAGLLGRTAAVLTGVPITICTVHNFVNHSRVPLWQKQVFRLLEKMLSPATTRYITVSQALAREISRLNGIPEDKIDVVYNGVNLENFNIMLDCKEKKSQLGLRPNSVIIGTAGRLIATKGVSYFIEAARTVKKKFPLTQFIIVGEGPQRPALEKLARDLEMEGEVFFLGYRRDLLSILPLINVFVIPSVSEGQSIVTLEAMAARRPVVAFKTGGIPELLTHRRSGILVPEMSPESLAEGIMEVLENPRLAEKMGNTARSVVESKFQQDAMVRKIEEIYRRCLREKGFALEPLFGT
jgi:glycosyltransferase involved in cell wall biosynthesis